MLGGCAQSLDVGTGDDDVFEGPDDDDSGPDDDDDDVTDDDDSGDEVPDDDDSEPLEPADLQPCANGSCWNTDLPVQECHTAAEDEDFSSGSYNVHRYRTSVGAETRIELTRTAGAWFPALVVADVDGTVLSDGEVGRVEDGLEVLVLESGRGGDVAEVLIVSDVSQDLDVFVTGWSAVDSDFVDFQPLDSTYSLRIQSVCDEQALDCSGPLVNGHPVAEPACGWLEYIGREVVPALAGSRDDRLDVAATVAWWSLKEGVLFLTNPIVYSNCGFVDGSEYIGPLETCPTGQAWQVGISGIQVPTFLDSRPSQQAAALYPSLTEDEVLEATAADALLSASETASVVASTDDLRTSWLLRNSPIGVTLQVDLVHNECVVGSYGWCYGTGWTATSLYAPDKPAAMGSIADIRAVLDGLAP